MIYFKADIRNATAATDDALTTSSVGIPVSLALASEFIGLAKTVVFKAGLTSVDIALVGDADSTTVPPDVLTVKGKYLTIGIYAADGNGTIVIPTVWATVGLVQEGAVPSGVDPSAPTPSWVAQVQSIASEANENAASALEKATAVETAAESGEFDGHDGADGTDGFSPTVSVTEITGGHRVTITDATGTQTFDVMDGINGTDGADGADGFSPTVSVAEIPGGHQVTITDVNGDHVFDVMDGQGGSGGGAVSSVNGQTGDVVLTADDVGALPDSTSIPTKTSDLTNDSGFITSAPVQSVNGKTGAVVLTASDVGAGTYTKPSGGIPASDLAPGVIPSVPVQSVNGKTGAVVLDAEDVGALPEDTPIPAAVTEQTVAGWGFTKNTGTYSKPSGGIPKTDLASDVQTSLGKADTALQSYTETDPTVPSWAKTSSKPSYTASEVGAIAAPSSPATGAFLVWNGTAWVAQTLSTWSGGSY